MKKRCSILLLFLLIAGQGSMALAQRVLVKPYVQPGPMSSLTEKDVNLLHWMTDEVAGSFEVRYGGDERRLNRAHPVRTPLRLNRQQRYYKYSAALTNLPLNARIQYEVTLNGERVRTNSFSTRKSVDQPIDFIVIGDMASGRPEQKEIAFQMWEQQSDFAVLVGDMVYSRGRVSEYLQRFWPVYGNPDVPGRAVGAPWMASVVVHGVIGNHDVASARLEKYPDGLGAFYFFSAKRRAYLAAAGGFPLSGSPAQRLGFRRAAGMSFPALMNYSFDNGAAHFVALDLNSYSDVNAPAFRQWLRHDLMQNKDKWIFVFCHQPGFHAAATHYEQQKLRLLQPLFEEAGVDIVFAGHVHNYQRSRPLKFAPRRRDAKGYVDGVFQFDEAFDGERVKKANGVIHIVTGGGGANLVSAGAAHKKGERGLQNWADYTVKFVANRHTFTRVIVTEKEVHLRQLDSRGKLVDEFRMEP